jgi:hypothetical protein
LAVPSVPASLSLVLFTFFGRFTYQTWYPDLDLGLRR